jgi:signal transduction histidine kinase
LRDAVEPFPRAAGPRTSGVKPPRAGGLARRIYLAFLATALLPAALAGAIGVWVAFDRLRDATMQGLQQEISARGNGLRLFFNSVSAELRFLAAEPEAIALVSLPPDAAEAPGSAAQLARSYARLVRAQPEVYQLRLLDARGLERVRVERRPDGVAIVPPAELQDKADRYYVRDALAQPVGAIYVSPLDLNIERGKIEVPERPVIRLATVVTGAGGAVTGMVIMNVHAQLLIEPVQQMAQAREGTAYLFDSSGQFLARGRDATGGLLMQPVSRLAEAGPDVLEKLLSSRAGHLDAGGRGWAHAPVDLGGAGAPRWALAIAVPQSALLDQVVHLGTLYAVLGGALLLAAFAGYSLSRRLIGPMHELAREADAIAAGDLDRRVTIDGRDEVAWLGERFNLMAARLQATLTQLEQHRHLLQGEVAARTHDLAAERARLAAVLRHASDAIAAVHPSGDVLFANPAARRLLDEVAGGPEAVAGALRQLIDDGPERQEITLGSRTLSVSRAALPPSEGSGELVIVARDVTQERHRADEKRERDRQLFQLDKLATVGELAMGIAHEIGNPLAGMKAVVQSMRMEAGLGAEMQQDLQRLESEIDRLSRFLASMRGLAAPRVPQLSAQPLAAAVDDMLFWIRKQAAQSGVAIELDIAPGLPPLAADAAQLREVLLNLFVNALHAMPGGGRLQIAALAEDGQALIEIRDSGSGIPPELQPRIFQPFFTTRSDGSGLGLAICAKVLQDHRGRIAVESRPGDTCFRLHWPLHHAPGADDNHA